MTSKVMTHNTYVNYSDVFITFILSQFFENPPQKIQKPSSVLLTNPNLDFHYFSIRPAIRSTMSPGPDTASHCDNGIWS